MSVHRLAISAMLAGIFSFWIGAAAYANKDEGSQLTAACAACHRLDGHDTGIPSIVGVDPDQLAERIRAFRSDERANHLMHAVSLTLTDAEVMAIARHLATLGTQGKVP